MSRGNTPTVLDLIKERERIKRLCIIEAKRRIGLRAGMPSGGCVIAIATTRAPD